MSRARVALSWAEHKLRRFASRAALERHQLERARRLVEHVHANSPFYRARLGAPTLDALFAMPRIDKRVMMEHFDTLNTRGIGRERAMQVALRAEHDRNFYPTLEGLTVGLSSGTSGSRGLFLVSDEERYAWAGAILARLLPGALVGPRRDRVAFFLRANSNLYESMGSRRVVFRYFDLLEPLEAQLARLEQLAPTVLVAPPSLLVALAERVERGELRLHPERVISVAEVLDPLDEARVRRAFRTTVRQVYQATEGLLGTSCAYGTVHLAEDLCIFEREVLDADRRTFVPIVTDLFRRTQPILRYRLDDVLVERAVPCLCGSVLTGLERIEGRSDDVFLVELSPGRYRPLYPDFVRRAVITNAPEVRSYHVRQRAPQQLELFFAAPGDAPELELRIARALTELFVSFGGSAPSIVRVAEPLRAPGQKLRRVERAFSPPPDGLAHVTARA